MVIINSGGTVNSKDTMSPFFKNESVFIVEIVTGTAGYDLTHIEAARSGSSTVKPA